LPKQLEKAESQISIIIITKEAAMPVRIEGAIDIGGNIFITSELQVSGASSFNRVSGDRVYVWTGAGSIVLPMSGTVDYLIAAGGGAGATGSDNQAGGGAGGLIMGSFTAQPNQLYTITVGAGAVMTYAMHNATGGNSSISGGSTNLVALGGGSASSDLGGGVTSPQSAGGSGAGSRGMIFNQQPGSAGLQASSSSGGYGNNGGTGRDGGIYDYTHLIAGAGGGGAGAVGGNAYDNGYHRVHGGNGGDGISSDITGISVYYCGGGGGAGSPGRFGQPGNPADNGQNGQGGGVAGYGGGGHSGEFGGAGIVILRFGFM
jgi:hypothetical protein